MLAYAMVVVIRVRAAHPPGLSKAIAQDRCEKRTRQSLNLRLHSMGIGKHLPEVDKVASDGPGDTVIKLQALQTRASEGTGLRQRRG